MTTGGRQWASRQRSEGTKRSKRDQRQRDENGEREMSKARHQKDVANVAIFQFVKEDPLQFQIKKIRKKFQRISRAISPISI